MVKHIQKRANKISGSGDIIAEPENETSLERLQRYLAMIWVDNLTASQKRDCIKVIETVKTYHEDAPFIIRLYDYYDLYKWPSVLLKLERLKKKYRVTEE